MVLTDNISKPPLCHVKCFSLLSPGQRKAPGGRGESCAAGTGLPQADPAPPWSFGVLQVAWEVWPTSTSFMGFPPTPLCVNPVKTIQAAICY